MTNEYASLKLTKEAAKAFKAEIKAMSDEQLKAKKIELAAKYSFTSTRSQEQTILNSEIYTRDSIKTWGGIEGYKAHLKEEEERIAAQEAARKADKAAKHQAERAASLERAQRGEITLYVGDQQVACN